MSLIFQQTLHNGNKKEYACLCICVLVYLCICADASVCGPKTEAEVNGAWFYKGNSRWNESSRNSSTEDRQGRNSSTKDST